jgi:hypothetical protein
MTMESSKREITANALVGTGEVIGVGGLSAHDLHDTWATRAALVYRPPGGAA